MFSALVTARLRPIRAIEIEGGKGLQLKLRVHGQAVTAQLERYYERYRADTSLLTPVINQFIETLVSGVEGRVQGTEEFARIEPQLFPRLITAQQWMDKRNAGLRLVVRPVVQDLGEAVVMDRGNEFEYVPLEAIPTWGVDSQTVYDAALKNLERVSASLSTAQNGEGIETLLIAQADSYAAEQVLIPGWLTRWQARIQGELVLGLPTHDLLLGFARNHPAFDDLRAQVAEDASSQPDGLLPHLLILRDNTLELFDEHEL